jgi:subtilisin family serine protease
MVQLTSILATAILATAVSSAAATLPRVDVGVHRALRKQGSADLIITMKESTESTLNSLEEVEFASREQKISSLVDSLENLASATQRPVFEILNQESTSDLYVQSKSFWISNQVFVEGASAELVAKLSKIPEIKSIREQYILNLYEPISQGAVEANSTINSVEWGVERIQAPDVWAQGNTGEGIIVAAIDTGVRGTHEALKDNYRGAYGWFDPEKKADAPYDGNGHGSHTMGTIAGANGLGVAPGAQWMACKGCRSSSCPESDLLGCGQFMTCPTDTKGENKDCSKAPHLVSNSWGGGQGSSFYQAVVDAWQKAGIIPIFANGNSGPSCGTANSPGDYSNVIAVGATDINDGLASFSSKGPSRSGLLKPEISAPGVNIRSSWSTGDNAYLSISGTSMATPHVAGAAALFLAANPNANFEDVRTALIGTVDTNLKSAGKTCGGTVDGKFPNNNYGYGRMNIYNAIYTDPTPAPTSPPTDAPSPTPSGCGRNTKELCGGFWCRWDSATSTCVSRWW